MPDIESGSARARPTKRQRWQSSGSASEHIAAILCSLRRLDQLRQPGAKFGRRRHLLVIRSPLRIHLRPFGASAELLAEKHIVDACPASDAAKAFLLKCGEKRETGAERTSATAVTCAVSSSDRNRSSECREWPMVRIGS